MCFKKIFGIGKDPYTLYKEGWEIDPLNPSSDPETQNAKKAFKLYLKAAKKECLPAQNNVAVFYEKGLSVNQDDDKAIHWWSKALKRGDSYAQYNFGWMCAHGYGVEPNDKKAFFYYNLVANKYNIPEAQNNLALMFLTGRGTGRDVLKAINLYEQAANSGSHRAFFNLGWIYENGCGVEKNLEKALGYYQKGKDYGNPKASKSFDRLKEIIQQQTEQAKREEEERQKEQEAQQQAEQAKREEEEQQKEQEASSTHDQEKKD